MKIKRMTATFGKLKNSSLELEPGLNIVQAPNEHGKSTWCGFISAMLYGIDTSERDRNGYLSAKTRFRPWDGGEMVGTMELSFGGKDITIQRTTKGTSPMKKFIAVYSGTADFIKNMSGETAGEELTGVTKTVFERTAFIRRPDLKISQTADLEKRISSIVSTGDENTSYTEADSLLRAWQRRLRYNKSTGSLPAHEQALRDAQNRLGLLESSSDEIANLRGTIGRLEKQIDLMEHDLEIHDKLDKRAAFHKLQDAKSAAQSAVEKVNELTKAITKNGHQMTRDDINDVRETAAAVIPLRNIADDAERTLWQAEKDLSDIIAKRNSSPLNGCPEEAVNADISEAKLLEERIRSSKERKPKKLLPIAITVLGIIGIFITSGLLHPFSRWIPAVGPIFELSIPGIIASAIVLAAGIALFFIKPPKKRTDSDVLSDLLAKYNVNSSGKLSSLLSSYMAIVKEEENLRAKRDSAKSSFESSSTAAKEAESKAVLKLSPFMPEVTRGEDVLAALNETESLIEQLTHAQFDMVSAQNIYETLSAEYDESQEIDESYLPVPIRNRQDTLAALSRTRNQLTDATRAYDLATGAQRALGDPAVIEGEIQSLQENIAEETRQYEALDLAIRVLSEANSELQTRFSPLISKKAGDIMQAITDGRYEKLVFDKGFDADAKETDSPVVRNVLSLSDGTADEAYFSLRLAMCQLILDGKDPCPIILDDALINFDDTRCKNALDLLYELSKERQIILFTCHNRESQFMAGKSDVNILLI